jgi:hypothetical protein
MDHAIIHRRAILRVSAALDDASAALDDIAQNAVDGETIGPRVAAIFRSLSDLIVQEAANVRAAR